MFDLTGKIAVVTGASGGIGSQIARTLAGAGAAIALTGTRAGVLDQVISDIKAELPNATLKAFPINLSDPDAAAALIKQVEDEMGPPAILINNAGITKDNLAMRLKDEDWNDVIALNLSSAFRLSRAVMRPMMKQKWGRIISITSVVGQIGNAGQANYAAAKAGLVGMSKSLAHELASRNITVNCIAPGFIVTPMTDALDDGQKESLMTRIPMGRFGEGAEIAAAALYLASDEAGYITGQTLHVNGGMVMV